MKRTPLFALLAIVLMAISCSGSKDEGKGGNISISGAFALYPLVVKWAEEYKKIHPDVNIDIQAGGAGKGIADALANQVDLGMVSRDLKKEEISQGAWFIPVTRDAVLPVFNDMNPNKASLLKKGVPKETFEKLWIKGEPVTWGDLAGTKDAEQVKVYKRSDAAGAAESWAKYLGKKQDDMQGTGVYGDPGLVQAVLKDVNGVGFNNVIYAYDTKTKKPFQGIQIIPIDINSNGKIDEDENFYESLEKVNAAIEGGKYPSPPARDLFLVSKGKPKKKAVLDFLNWIMADGQKYVREAGFNVLSPDKITATKAKLK